MIICIVACMDSLQTQNDDGKDYSQKRVCQHCGEYVTKQFVRVFGANDGSLYGCMNCSTGRELRNGGSKRPSK